MLQFILVPSVQRSLFNRYDHGIQSFDTANVYSNGDSEVILGKAIKQFNLPREEIVVMTKVRLFPMATFQFLFSESNHDMSDVWCSRKNSY